MHMPHTGAPDNENGDHVPMMALARRRFENKIERGL